VDAPEVPVILRTWNAPFLAYRSHEQHIWAVHVHFEIVGDALPQNRRCERPERFAILDLQVHDRLHGGIARIADDTATTQRSRAELHTPGEPPDNLSLCKIVRHAAIKRFIAQAHSRSSGSFQKRLDFTIGE